MIMNPLYLTSEIGTIKRSLKFFLLDYVLLFIERLFSQQRSFRIIIYV